MDLKNDLFDDLPITSAAKAELDMVARTSFSDDGFTSAEKEAIANAIAAGIRAYEEHKNLQS